MALIDPSMGEDEQWEGALLVSMALQSILTCADELEKIRCAVDAKWEIKRK